MRYLLLCIVFLTGCNARNVELREYDGNKLVRQVRTGQVNFCYWFGLDEGAIAYVPDRVYMVGVKGLTEYPDPNSVKAVSEGVVEGLKWLK